MEVEDLIRVIIYICTTKMYYVCVSNALDFNCVSIANQNKPMQSKIHEY